MLKKKTNSNHIELFIKVNFILEKCQNKIKMSQGYSWEKCDSFEKSFDE